MGWHPIGNFCGDAIPVRPHGRQSIGPFRQASCPFDLYRDHGRGLPCHGGRRCHVAVDPRPDRGRHYCGHPINGQCLYGRHLETRGQGGQFRIDRRRVWRGLCPWSADRRTVGPVWDPRPVLRGGRTGRAQRHIRVFCSARNRDG